MKIIVTTVQVPFIKGGAEMMTSGLLSALQTHGHKVEIIALPFRFSPPSAVLKNMKAWEQLDLSHFDSGEVDFVISLKFPSYYASHPKKVVWLMHQHRSVYELYDTRYGESSSSHDARVLRDKIIEADTKYLSTANAVFTISKTVSDRLLKFNGVRSNHLYQPPPYEERYRPGEVYPYIYAPSRLEELKRHELLIRALKYINHPLFVVIPGEGGQKENLMRIAEEEGVSSRVKFLGHIDQETHIRLYSNAFCVFFAPLLEDYGFVTLEAMLSGKPVITCTDSGGPTEFVVDNETGKVILPDERIIADAINNLWSDRNKAKEMGMNAINHYYSMDISWINVFNTLVGSVC